MRTKKPIGFTGKWRRYCKGITHQVPDLSFLDGYERYLRLEEASAERRRRLEFAILRGDRGLEIWPEYSWVRRELENGGRVAALTNEPLNDVEREFTMWRRDTVSWKQLRHPHVSRALRISKARLTFAKQQLLQDFALFTGKLENVSAISDLFHTETWKLLQRLTGRIKHREATLITMRESRAPARKIARTLQEIQQDKLRMKRLIREVLENPALIRSYITVQVEAICNGLQLFIDLSSHKRPA